MKRKKSKIRKQMITRMARMARMARKKNQMMIKISQAGAFLIEL